MISPATWLVLATLSLTLVLFWGGYFIARASGQFEDLEAVKYKVLEHNHEPASGTVSQDSRDDDTD